MRTIIGFVVLVGLSDGRTLIFGKRVSSNKRVDLGITQEFLTNGLTPFDSKQEAVQAKYELAAKRVISHREYRWIVIGKIDMQIAETDAEMIEFENKRCLVAVCQGTDAVQLRGEWVPGMVRDDLPGADIAANSFVVIRNYEAASILVSRLRRFSTNTEVSMAKFHLARLEPIRAAAAGE